MSLLLAWKAFWKALRNPGSARQWLDSKQDGQKKDKERDNAHLRLLYLLQKTGRLIDFLKEDISPFTDAQVGAAVRKIHSECGRGLEEWVALRPLYQEKEGSSVTVPAGYNPREVKVVGKVRGNPPYQGILRHKGWKAHKLILPMQIGEGETEIVCPAEVEVKGNE